MKRSRLGIRRQSADVQEDDEGNRRATEEHPDTQRQASDDQADPVVRSWAADFAAEVEEGAGLRAPRQFEQQQASSEQMARQDSLVVSDSEEDELQEQAGVEETPRLASLPADDEEARLGLLKVIDSMRRRVDDGRVQLLCSQRLQQQKQQLIEQGQAVLEQHCAASWHQQQQQQQQAGAPTTGQQHRLECQVHSLLAACAAGQWWLQAIVSLPEQQHGIGPASLLVVSPDSNLVCRQQQCRPASNSEGGSVPGKAGCRSLQLTAALDIQRPQGPQQQQPGEATWVDVFLLLEQAARPALVTAAASSGGDVLAAPAVAAPPLLLGRVQLDCGEYLRSHSGSHQPAFQPPVCPPKQHRVALAVETKRLDLRCVSSIAQQLGFVPAVPAVSAAAGAGGSHHFVLQGAAAGCSADLPATATLRIAHHSSAFAEVLLQSSSCQLLAVLEEQLGAALVQAAQQAGLPSDEVTVQPSLLGSEYAQQQAAAAVALVEELDASIEWVETLLKEKLSLDSQHRRQKVPGPGLARVREVQGAALAAMAATDGHMASLLRQC